MLAALHFLALSEDVDPWTDPASTVREHANWIAEFILTRGVQTNEVQRCWALLPCFLELARRAGAQSVDLIELGPSAGLNLVWDRYRYRYLAGEWGPADSPLRLAGVERAPVPSEILGTRPAVRRRVGVDLNPIDVGNDDGARLLKCFVWADQSERLHRLDLAIDALRGNPPTLVRGDFVSLLPELLAGRDDDALTIVFETAALGYVSSEGRAEVLAALDRAGADAPLGFARTTSPPGGAKGGFGLSIRLWPGEADAVAYAGFHGAWLDWLA